MFEKNPCSIGQWGDFIGISPHSSHSVILNRISKSKKMYDLHNMIHGRRSSVGEYWLSVQSVDVLRKLIFFRFE